MKIYPVEENVLTIFGDDVLHLDGHHLHVPHQHPLNFFLRKIVLKAYIFTMYAIKYRAFSVLITVLFVWGASWAFLAFLSCCCCCCFRASEKSYAPFFSTKSLCNVFLRDIWALTYVNKWSLKIKTWSFSKYLGANIVVKFYSLTLVFCSSSLMQRLTFCRTLSHKRGCSASYK